MKKVVELVQHLRQWGATSGDVVTQISSLVFALNTPAPFESEPTQPDWNTIVRRTTEICNEATRSRRKGMMISSEFEVKLEDKVVNVYHIRNEKPPRLFLTIQPTKICNKS